jgi:hypothetical protein
MENLFPHYEKETIDLQGCGWPETNSAITSKPKACKVHKAG